jgi:Flp pilus assembly protein TadB
VGSPRTPARGLALCWMASGPTGEIGETWKLETRRSTARKERSTDAHERPVVTEANKEAVRAGHTGDHLRYILIASCALVIIAFIAVALFVRS